MTRRISLIAVAAFAVMAIAAPTALARYVPGDDPRSTAPATNPIADASDRAKADLSVAAPLALYSDAFERAAAAQRSTGAAVVGDSHNRFDPGTPVSVPTVSSGRDIEWPQIGIGFGVGILLGLGLLLMVRLTHIRPLAH